MTYSMGRGLRIGIVFSSFLIFLGGSAILGSAVWTAITIGSFQNLIGPYAGIFASVYLMLSVGIFVFLLAFFGCVGAMFDNKKMLFIYCGLLVIFFLVQVVGSVLIFVYYPLARNAAQNSMRQYNEDFSVQDGWDIVQGVLQCCGVNTYADWKQLADFPELPNSCCLDKVDTCSENSISRFHVGCDTLVEKFFIVIASVGFSMLLIELLTIALIVCAIRKLND